jgi:hypothetical protein
VTASDIHLKPGCSATQAAFDTDKNPSKYIGIKSPPQDPKEVAKEMFGLYPSADNPNAFYSPLNYGGPCGPFIPFFAQPGQFGVPFENFEQNAASASSGSCDASPIAAQLFHHYPQYAVPMPFPYMLGSQYPQVYNCGPYDGQGEKDGGAQNMNASGAPPMSVKVLSSSNQVEVPPGGVVTGAATETDERKKRNSNGDYSYVSEVSSLSSPLKRMKVADNSVLTDRPDDSISAYFADVSANSDEDAEENEEVSNIMSLFQQRQHAKNLPLAELNHISRKEKQELEQYAGTSDLDSLLNKGLESLAAKEMLQSPPPPSCNEATDTKYFYSDDSGGMTVLDMHDISTRVAPSQEESYYLPSLDSLLNMGEDTIVTMKTAMNLDIQGVVEIATEDDRQASAVAAVTTSTGQDEIQIN